MLVPSCDSYELGYYDNLRNCLHLNRYDLDSLQEVLMSERMLDCCYRVNSELMRKGASMMKRYNNPYLVEAILNREIPNYTAIEQDEYVLKLSKQILDPSKPAESIPFEVLVEPTNYYFFD